MKYLIIVLGLFASVIAKAQQEPHYTQNQFNSNLLMNPAYAGSDPDNTSIGLRYRNQWAGLTGAPKTFGITADTKHKNLGIGISFNYDKIGIERLSTPDLNLSYHIKLNENANLSIGLKGGAQFIKANFADLVNVNPSDPLYTSGGKLTIPFLGVGALYYTKSVYIGVASPRLFTFDRPSSPRSQVGASHYYAYGGARIIAKNELEFRPAFLVKYQPKAPIEIDLAVDAWYKNFLGFGVGYRSGDAVNFSVKSNISKNLYLGYSYDINTSRLRAFNNGSHEVFISVGILKFLLQIKSLSPFTNVKICES